MALVRSQVSDQYRRYGMDVTENEVDCIAATALEIGGVDWTSPRYTALTDSQPERKSSSSGRDLQQI